VSGPPFAVCAEEGFPVIQQNTLRSIKAFPIRFRVGCMLAVCENLLPIFSENKGALSASRAAIDDGWKWVGGAAVSACEIYDHLGSLVGFETTAIREEEIDAMCAIEGTVQYAAWHAFRVELRGVPSRTRPVPNDMADVTEDVIDEILDFATKADAECFGWVKKQLSNAANELGPTLSRREFGL
jgi:hypothetical protein